MLQLSGWCQTNANQSQFFKNEYQSGSKKTTPLCESSGAVQVEFLPTVEGAFLVEMVVDRGVDGCKILQASHPSEPQYRALPLSKWLMRILGAIVRSVVSPMTLGTAKNPHRRTVGS